MLCTCMIPKTDQSECSTDTPKFQRSKFVVIIEKKITVFDKVTEYIMQK